MSMDPAVRAPRFAVIGAGMSGILAAIELRRRGFENFTVYEKAARLGGTWRENTYPGVACDVPSHVYSYSFELKPDWSERFSPGREILGYLETTAAKYGVDCHIRYEIEIERAEFQNGRWQLTGSDGLADEVDFVIAATGFLHHPARPDIAGLAGFDGACFHTAQWDHSVDLTGKRVGIVGTGSTATQIVPAIVDRVGALTLFQRTPQWIMPLPNAVYSDVEKRMYREKPELLKQSYVYWAERFNETFARAVIGDRDELQRIEDICRANLENSVADSKLRAKLTPNYRAACKRIIMSDGFYQAIQRPNVHLAVEGIEAVEAGGVLTDDGRRHALDVLILATGFDGHAFTRPMQVVGAGGRTLDQQWAEGNEAYRSVAVPGFPNFFLLVGPNSPIGNFSIIMISELQLGYVMQLIDAAVKHNVAVAPTFAATQRFNAALRTAMKSTVWASGCRSWYLDKNGNPAMWPWSFEQFEADMRRVDMNDFELK